MVSDIHRGSGHISLANKKGVLHIYFSKWISCSLHLQSHLTLDNMTAIFFSAIKAFSLLIPLDGHLFKYS